MWPGVVNNVHSWQPLINAKHSHSTVDVWAIINPNSGPGDKSLPEYVNGIKLLKNAKINVLGYVATNYGAKSAESVKSEIDKYIHWYTIDGIFFDEMAYDNNAQHFSYYKNISSYAKGKSLTKTVGNPGTETLKAYVGSVDTIVIYESDKGFPNETQYGGWHKDYPKSDWAVLSYNISSLDSNKVKDAKNFVQYIYVTDDKLPNPWDTIPYYINELFLLLV